MVILVVARREPIFVVGGGLGGLTTALALSRRSLDARVLEGVSEFGAARTDLLICSVPTLIEMISVAMSLEPGDVIVTGTAGGRAQVTCSHAAGLRAGEGEPIP
jgi:2-keto-4-pentenoate hydratase/2-oxohepta-3-ene-1,7-dioic acid hydratase in catechol pathway